MLQNSISPTQINIMANDSVEHIEGQTDGGLLIICDHATNRIPEQYRDLDIEPAILNSHVGYDIGVRRVTQELSKMTQAPALLSRFSRLLIDPNRGIDDPTLIMKIADGSVVSGNVAVDKDEIAKRIAAYYDPYHAAIRCSLDAAIETGVPPAILSVHSFTPTFKNQIRPWHAAILWDADPRLPHAILHALQQEPALIIGENVPYTGRLHGDTLYRHGTTNGLAHALIEIRQDLISDEDGQLAWARRLHKVLTSTMRNPEMNRISYHLSSVDT
jgi:predicted N-formylglutamate amidohydrolase